MASAVQSLVHLRVASATSDELVVRAGLDDAAVIDDDDPVGLHGGRQTVRDQHGGARLEQHVERRFDLGLGGQVEVGRGLVEHQHARLRVCRAGQRNSAGVRPTTETGRAHGPRCQGPAACARRYRAATASTASCRPPHRSRRAGRRRCCHAATWRTREGLLRHHAELATQRVQSDVAEIVSVQQHASGGGVVEARDQLGRRRLARAGLAYERDRLTGGDAEVIVAQNRLVGEVAEANILKDDLAVDRG